MGSPHSGGYSHTPEGGGEPQVPAENGLNKEFTTEWAGSRGTKIVEQYTRDGAGEDWNGFDDHEATVGRSLEGGCDNISTQIKNGRVPME